MKSDAHRSFEEFRHPLREAGRERFLEETLGNEVRELVPDPRAILVLGSGDGKEALALLGIFHKAAVVSMDLSVPETETASGNPTLRGRIVRGDWDRPPFPEGTFDLVVFFAALHHSTDLEQTLRRVYSLLRSGGAFYATHEPMSSILLGFFQRRRMEKIARQEGGIENSPSFSEYAKSLSKAGFVSPSIRSSQLNLIRLLNPVPDFQDVSLRRNPWPEKWMARCLRFMKNRTDKEKLALLFRVQRLAFGLFGVTITGRKP